MGSRTEAVEGGLGIMPPKMNVGFPNTLIPNILTTVQCTELRTTAIGRLISKDGGGGCSSGARRKGGLLFLYDA